VRPEGANHQWRKNPPRELSIDLVADERLVRATMSEDGKRSVAAWPKRPRPSSTLPKRRFRKFPLSRRLCGLSGDRSALSIVFLAACGSAAAARDERPPSNRAHAHDLQTDWVEL
jgi:hypothetical protein